MSKIKYIDLACSHCGSTAVRRDADASWNKYTSEWELGTVYDKPSICETCEGETSLIEIEVEEELISPPRACPPSTCTHRRKW